MAVAPDTEASANRTSILVHAALRGDRDGFDRLCRRLYVRLWAYARGHVGSADDAEDVVGATFERMLATLPRFDPGRGDFPGWVFGILHNVLAEALRGGVGLQQQRIGRLTRVAADSELWSRLARTTGRRREHLQDLAQRLHRAIERLDPLQRDVIRFRRLEGVSVPEAARRLKITDTYVTTLDQRARARLRELLVRAQ